MVHCCGLTNRPARHRLLQPSILTIQKRVGSFERVLRCDLRRPKQVDAISRMMPAGSLYLLFLYFLTLLMACCLNRTYELVEGRLHRPLGPVLHWGRLWGVGRWARVMEVTVALKAFQHVLETSLKRPSLLDSQELGKLDSLNPNRDIS